MFQTLYDLIATYIFDGAVEIGSYPDLVCVLVATIGNLALVALPFALVIKIVTSVLK